MCDIVLTHPDDGSFIPEKKTPAPMTIWEKMWLESLKLESFCVGSPAPIDSDQKIQFAVAPAYHWAVFNFTIKGKRWSFPIGKSKLEALTNAFKEGKLVVYHALYGQIEEICCQLVRDSNMEGIKDLLNIRVTYPIRMTGPVLPPKAEKKFLCRGKPTTRIISLKQLSSIFKINVLTLGRFIYDVCPRYETRCAHTRFVYKLSEQLKWCVSGGRVNIHNSNFYDPRQCSLSFISHHLNKVKDLAVELRAQHTYLLCDYYEARRNYGAEVTPKAYVCYGQNITSTPFDVDTSANWVCRQLRIPPQRSVEAVIAFRMNDPAFRAWMNGRAGAAAE
jgi:hypothetical protein